MFTEPSPPPPPPRRTDADIATHKIKPTKATKAMKQSQQLRQCERCPTNDERRSTNALQSGARKMVSRRGAVAKVNDPSAGPPLPPALVATRPRPASLSPPPPPPSRNTPSSLPAPFHQPCVSSLQLPSPPTPAVRAPVPSQRPRVRPPADAFSQKHGRTAAGAVARPRARARRLSTRFARCGGPAPSGLWRRDRDAARRDAHRQEQKTRSVSCERAASAEKKRGQGKKSPEKRPRSPAWDETPGAPERRGARAARAAVRVGARETCRDARAQL